MAKFTPGPWEANDGAEVYSEGKQSEGLYSMAIALCDAYKRPLGECRANARLIAKAPEMYKMLRDVEYNVVGHGTERRKRILALLAEIDGDE